jgi:hypothetical protein
MVLAGAGGEYLYTAPVDMPARNSPMSVFASIIIIVVVVVAMSINTKFSFRPPARFLERAIGRGSHGAADVAPSTPSITHDAANKSHLGHGICAPKSDSKQI